MKLLVVDDHPLMAEALALAVHGLDGSVTVQIARDLDAAYRRLQVAGDIDLVLLDLGLPGCAGLEALEQLRGRFASVPVVVVSGSNEPSAILAALDMGAMGFIPKSSSKDVLLGAVRLVASGGIYVPVEALGARAADIDPVPASTPPRRTTASELGISPRQAEVLGLLLKGLPNKLIARKLDISENTTKIHVSAVLRALGVVSRTQALIAASRLGLRIDA